MGRGGQRLDGRVRMSEGGVKGGRGGEVPKRGSVRPCGPSFPNVCVRVAAFYSFFTVFRNAPPHPTRGGIPRESIIVGRERCARACVRACVRARVLHRTLRRGGRLTLDSEAPR